MNTKSTLAKQSRVPTSSRQERIATTLRQHMADVARGEYLRELREGRHETQQDVADAVEVSLRAYQAWEAGGKIKWLNAKRLGLHFGINPEGLTTREGDDATPDPFNGTSTEEDVDDLREIVLQMRDELRVLAAEVRRLPREGSDEQPGS